MVEIDLSCISKSLSALRPAIEVHSYNVTCHCKTSSCTSVEVYKTSFSKLDKYHTSSSSTLNNMKPASLMSIAALPLLSLSANAGTISSQPRNALLPRADCEFSDFVCA